jgi:hypothetical protein
MTMIQCLSCGNLELCTYPEYNDGAAGANCMYYLDDDDFIKSFATEHMCGKWTKRKTTTSVVSGMTHTFSNGTIDGIKKISDGIITMLETIDRVLGIHVILYDKEHTDKEDMRRELIDNFDEWWDSKE